MIAFFDASALIYLIEATAPFHARVREALAHVADQDPGVQAALSRLSWLECRTGPLKADAGDVLAKYDAWFARPDLIWVDLTREVIELATAIRVRHGLRTPDSLQAACCLQLGARHVFLTGDRAFRRVSGLNVQMME